MSVPDEVVEAIQVAVRKELAEMLGAEPRLVGEFLRDELDRRRRRRELFERVKQSVAGWLVIAVLSGVGLAVWHWFQHQVRR